MTVSSAIMIVVHSTEVSAFFIIYTYFGVCAEITTCCYKGLPKENAHILLRFSNEGPSCNAKVSH
jgi:hypothetical protein